MADKRLASVSYDGAGFAYVIIRQRTAEGWVWNGIDFVVYNPAHITSYDEPLTSAGGDLWTATIPDGIRGGDYTVQYYERSGGTPAVTDRLLKTDYVTWAAAEDVPEEPDDTASTDNTDIAGLTVLDAVNELLEAIGEYPASMLDSGGQSDVAQAETIIHAETKKVLAEYEWHQTTEDDVTLAVEANGRIPLASNILRVDTMGRSQSVNVARRGPWLYDLKNHTYTFTEPVTCKLVKALAFHECTPALKDYITKRAKLRFQRAVQGSVAQDRLVLEELENAKRAAFREDTANQDLNILTGTALARRIRGNRNIYYH